MFLPSTVIVPNDVLLKRFEQPDETRVFELGRYEVVTIGGMTIGRATYQPGWRWPRTSARRPARRTAPSSTSASCCQDTPRR